MRGMFMDATNETYMFFEQWEADGRQWCHPRRLKGYGMAAGEHGRSCRGEWVESWMVRPSVSDLFNVSGRQRDVRTGLRLWRDDRPGMSRAEFTALRVRLLGRVSVDGERDAA